MKKNTSKKGFTIVELVIVIAIIAILAAVLIPTFSSIIKRAKLSNDQSMIRNMNLTLTAEVIPGTKYDYAGDAILALNANGFSGKYTPFSSGFHYGYHLESNKMYLINEDNQVVYPDSSVSVADLWVIWANNAVDKVAGATKYVSLVNITGGYYATHFAAGTNYSLDLGGHFLNVADTLSNVTVMNGVLISGATSGNQNVVAMEEGTKDNLSEGNAEERTVVENKVFHYTEELRDEVEKTAYVTYKNCYFYSWLGQGGGVMGANVTFENCKFIDATGYIFNVQGDSGKAYEGTLTVKGCEFINCARVFNIPVFVYGEDQPGSIVITGNTFHAVTGPNRGLVQLNKQITSADLKDTLSTVTKGYIDITFSDNTITDIATTQAGLFILHEYTITGKSVINTVSYEDANYAISADHFTFSGNTVDSSIPTDKYVVNDDGLADSAFDPYNAAEFKAALIEKFNAGKK